jgi:hypothetical protein
MRSSKLQIQSRGTNSEEEMRASFAGVDSFGGKGEPTAKERALIRHLIKRHRSLKRRG